jgi:hypothetical protein
MRTTLTIDDDVLDKAKAVAAKLRAPFRHVVNEALRTGLQTVEDASQTRPDRTRPHNMGLKAGRNLDNIQALLSQIEGEDHHEKKGLDIHSTFRREKDLARNSRRRQKAHH